MASVGHGFGQLLSGRIDFKDVSASAGAMKVLHRTVRMKNPGKRDDSDTPGPELVTIGRNFDGLLSRATGPVEDLRMPVEKPPYRDNQPPGESKRGGR